MRSRALFSIPILALACVAPDGERAGDTQLWPGWRGPDQDGTSRETGLPDVLQEGDQLWTFRIAGRGTPVVHGDRLYGLGYEGEAKDLQEVLFCLDARSGELLWEDRWSDFLTDVIYDRYAIGSPAVDPATGEVYVHTTAGLLRNYSADGELLWERSFMEELGRLSFPNGRTGAPLIDGERVIVHIINSNWGPQGPARDRFYAFDKHSGEVLWSCTPGEGPKDSSFSQPVLDWEGGRRVLYAGTGCGNLVCVDARTGSALWRFKMSVGGVNSAPLVLGDSVIAIHGRENVDSSTIGRMVRVRRGHAPGAEQASATVLDSSHELWRNELVAFTSSPVLVGERIYQTVATGELCAVDALSGEILWRHKLAPDQIHASPAWADGKLYVPMNNGSLHVVRPTDAGPEVLSSTQLEGSALGAPAIADGRIFVHTTSALYCFGASAGSGASSPMGPLATDGPGPLAPAHLQVIPSELVLAQGESVSLSCRVLDEMGALLGTHDVVAMASGEPSFRASPGLAGALQADGHLSLAADAPLGVGVVSASLGGLEGSARVRVVPSGAYQEDFEGFELGVPSKTEPGVMGAFPPSHWLGARLKWEVLERDGNKLLAKTLDNPLFQRSLGFFGDPEMSGYSMQADIMTDGNRRSKSSAGIIVQRYLIQLKGNHQMLEVSSNMERVKEGVSFRWREGVWYTLKARVDLRPDGAGVVRAKAWPREEPEPEGWTLEVEHANAHKQGSPGFFGIAPQSRFRVYMDNIEVTPDE